MFGKLRVGIIGTGRIAGVMAETLKVAKGVTGYAVGSRSIDNATKFAREHGIRKFYGSYAELVSDPKVDIVYVATPHSEHFENVKLALSAGKNVICEKAFMLNEKQAKEVFDIAEEKKLLLTEAMWTRYMPIMDTLREVLASKVIGEATMLNASLGFNIEYKDRIKQPELGGGALLDLGVYPLNFASMVFGNDVSDIASICTYNCLGVDMQDSITLRYANGRMAQLSASAVSVSDRKAVIYGTKGFIVVDDINNPTGFNVYDNNYQKIANYKRPKQKTGYEYEIEACVKAIEQGWIECPQMPHSETLKMLNMMDYIRRANNIVFPGENQESDAAVPQFKTPDPTRPEGLSLEPQVPQYNAANAEPQTMAPEPVVAETASESVTEVAVVGNTMPEVEGTEIDLDTQPSETKTEDVEVLQGEVVDSSST